jgi:RimJ/RimL family protein N-acetyltransferase
MIAPMLTTDRLAITPMSMAHWEAYALAWADPQMTAFIGGKPRARGESWPKFVQGVGLWTLFGYGFWTFIDRETGAFVGNGGLARFERGIPQIEGFPEAGWAFIPDVWGKGYATEAMTAILDWADANLDAPETRCMIDPENSASLNVAKKLGYQQFSEVESAIGRSALFARPRPR